MFVRCWIQLIAASPIAAGACAFADWCSPSSQPRYVGQEWPAVEFMGLPGDIAGTAHSCLSGNFVVDADDVAYFESLLAGTSPYNAQADFDLDGDIDNEDADAFYTIVAANPDYSCLLTGISTDECLCVSSGANWPADLDGKFDYDVIYIASEVTLTGSLQLHARFRFEGSGTIRVDGLDGLGGMAGDDALDAPDLSLTCDFDVHGGSVTLRGGNGGDSETGRAGAGGDGGEITIEARRIIGGYYNANGGCSGFAQSSSVPNQNHGKSGNGGNINLLAEIDGAALIAEADGGGESDYQPCLGDCCHASGAGGNGGNVRITARSRDLDDVRVTCNGGRGGAGVLGGDDGTGGGNSGMATIRAGRDITTGYGNYAFIGRGGAGGDGASGDDVTTIHGGSGGDGGRAGRFRLVAGRNATLNSVELQPGDGGHAGSAFPFSLSEGGNGGQGGQGGRWAPSSIVPPIGGPIRPSQWPPPGDPIQTPPAPGVKPVGVTPDLQVQVGDKLILLGSYRCRGASGGDGGAGEFGSGGAVCGLCCFGPAYDGGDGGIGGDASDGGFIEMNAQTIEFQTPVWFDADGAWGGQGGNAGSGNDGDPPSHPGIAGAMGRNGAGGRIVVRAFGGSPVQPGILRCLNQISVSASGSGTTWRAGGSGGNGAKNTLCGIGTSGSPPTPGAVGGTGGKVRFEASNPSGVGLVTGDPLQPWSLDAIVVGGAGGSGGQASNGGFASGSTSLECHGCGCCSAPGGSGTDGGAGGDGGGGGAFTFKASQIVIAPDTAVVDVSGGDAGHGAPYGVSYTLPYQATEACCGAMTYYATAYNRLSGHGGTGGPPGRTTVPGSFIVIGGAGSDGITPPDPP